MSTLSSVRCPYCGAAVQYGKGDVVVTCPYCGTTIVIAGKQPSRHLMGRVNYGINEVYSFFKEWALRKPEAPNDLPGRARLKDYTLTFYPYWVYKVDVVFRYEGSVRGRRTGGTESEKVVVSVPANTSMYGTPLEEHRFSLRGKVFFSSSYAARVGGTVLNANVTSDRAWEKAWSKIVRIVEEKIKARGIQLSRLVAEEYHVDGPYYVHVPVYTATYEYDGGIYKFLADATDNRIIYSEIPLGKGFRALALAASAVTGVVAFGFFGLGLLLRAPAFAFVSSLTTLLVAAYVAYKGLRTKMVTTRPYAE